jgi:sec-independent protein translocase protein TatA
LFLASRIWREELKMPNLGTTELIIILVIVVLIFGLGRLPRLARELGDGIHDFRAALADEKEDPKADQS